MAIIDSKERTNRPFNLRIQVGRLHNIQNYSNSVFIVVSHDSLVCIRSIGLHFAIFSSGTFCGLVMRQHRDCGEKGHGFSVTRASHRFVFVMFRGKQAVGHRFMIGCGLDGGIKMGVFFGRVPSFISGNVRRSGA